MKLLSMVFVEYRLCSWDIVKFNGAESFLSFDVFQGSPGKSGDKGVSGRVVSCTKPVFFLLITWSWFRLAVV